MLFQDTFESILDQSFFNLGAEMTLIDVFLVVFWGIFLSFIIANTYKATHRGVSYSQNFTQTLVLLGLCVSIVMIIVGTNIARAFTLVGALAIVRFRTAIKDTRDVGFIFFVMVVGMACGTFLFPVAIILTVAGCGLMYYMTFAEYGQKGLAQDILELHFPTSQDYAKVLSPIFARYLKYYTLLSVDSVDENTNRLSFVVTFKSKLRKRPGLPSKRTSQRDTLDILTPKSALLSEIQKIEKVNNVKIIDGSHSLEI